MARHSLSRKPNNYDPAHVSKNRISRKAASFTESVIREMTREAMKYGAVNLGQGFPDWAAPEDIKQKAMEAIEADHNQYAITWGVKSFRDAIAAKQNGFLDWRSIPKPRSPLPAARPRGMLRPRNHFVLAAMASRNDFTPK